MADKKLAGKRVLFVIAPEQFRDEELLEPRKILTDAGAQATVASTEPREATGMLGAKVHPDATIDGVRAADYQAVIVVGGMGSPTHLWENSRLQDIIRECHAQGKVVAAICLSGAVLAKAGVLKNKAATVWSTPDSLKALQAGGAKYVQEHVVQDANIITADGPEAANEFGNTVLQALLKTAAGV